MRGLARFRIVVAVATCTGCTITEVDLQTNSFRCDTSHACPANLTCLNGSCTMLSATADGIICGSQTCAAGRICCTNDVVQTCLDASDTCSANRQICDGPEDCSGGNVCCESTTTTTCRAGAGCNTLICSDASDCPQDEAKCCPNADTGWKTCAAVCT
jgi:hypothetical protein